jgi:hypothetical protein
MSRNVEKQIKRNLRLVARIAYMPKTKSIYEGNKSIEITPDDPRWDKTKYNITLLVKKQDGKSEMEKRLFSVLDDINKEAIEKGFIKSPIPIGGTASYKHFIRNGDDETQFKKYNEIYRGNWVLSVKPKKLKNIYTIDGVEVTENNIKSLIEDEIYSGVTVLTNIFVYFLGEGNVGIYASPSITRVVEKTPKFFENSINIEDFKLTPEEVLYLKDLLSLYDDNSDDEDDESSDNYSYDY